MINNALYDIREERLITVLNNIKIIRIKNGTRTISKHAFFGLQIQYIYLPETIIEVDETAFYYCSQLKSIIVSKNQYPRMLNIIPSYVKEYVTNGWFILD